MSQNSLKTPVTGTVSGVQLSENVSAIAEALATNNSGPTEPETKYPYMWWADTSANALKRRNAGNTAWISVMSLSLAISTFAETLLAASTDSAARSVIGVVQHGQCRLTKSGSTLILLPFNGNKIVINGAQQTIPSAGVTLASTGLTANTLYNIYAYMNAGAIALETSTAAHATDAKTGVEIKSGDATRTLVGMARTITGPAWQDTAAQRFVLSWFNRKQISGNSAFTANRATTSLTYVEINSEIRVEFLTWAR